MCSFARKQQGRKRVIVFFAGTSVIGSLSLISFFVPRDNIPGRLGVLVTLYLTLISLYKSLQIPSNIGFGYIDVWFILIQVPILVAIFEYGFILVWMKYCSKNLKARISKYIDLFSFCAVLAYLGVIIQFATVKLYD